MLRKSRIQTLIALSVIVASVSLSQAEELDLNQSSNDEILTNQEPNKGFHISPSFVFSKVNVDSNYADEAVRTNAYGASVVLGYEFDFNVLLQIEQLYTYNFSLGGAYDRYALDHFGYQVGYRLEWDKVSIIPLYGKANWQITSKEGQLLNSGEEEVKTLDGSDDMWGVNLLGRVNLHTEAILSYKKVDTEIGGYELINMGIIYQF